MTDMQRQETPMNTTTTTNEDEERAWRMSLAVGDEVAIIAPENPEWGHNVTPVVKIVRGRIYTGWNSYFQDTGGQTGRNPYWRITRPTQAGREQHARREEARRIEEAIRKTPLSSQSISRLRAIAWVLDIDHGSGVIHEEARQVETPITGKLYASDTVRFDENVNPHYQEHDDVMVDKVCYMHTMADFPLAFLCERLGGSVRVTSAEYDTVLAGLSLTWSWYEDGSFVLKTTREAK
jgi:hypothetical protein